MIVVIEDNKDINDITCKHLSKPVNFEVLKLTLDEAF